MGKRWGVVFTLTDPTGMNSPPGHQAHPAASRQGLQGHPAEGHHVLHARQYPKPEPLPGADRPPPLADGAPGASDALFLCTVGGEQGGPGPAGGWGDSI